MASSSSTSSSRVKGGHSLRRKRLLAIVLVVLGVLALDRGGAWALGELVKASQFRFSMLYRGDVAADVVSFGNSRAVHAFRPAILEQLTCKSAFDFSFNNLSMESIEVLVADFFERNPAPEVVLIEGSALIHGGARPSVLSPYAGESQRLRAAFLSEAESILPWREGFHLSRFNSELLQRALYYLGRQDQSWGFTQAADPDLLDAAKLEELPLQPPEQMQANAKALARIVALVERHGSEVVIYLAPNSPGRLQVEPELAELAVRISRILESSVQVLDMNGRVTELTYFADSTHLNLAGSEVMLKMIAEEMGWLSQDCPG